MAATLRCDTIQNASSSTANLTLDDAGNATVGNTLAMGSSFKRNRLINGNFAVDQRNAGTSYAVTTTTSYGSCDRWFWLAGANSVFTAQQVATGNSDFPYALRVQRAASSTSTQYVYYAQIIETINCQDLAGQTVTLSFYANAGSSAAATYPLNYQVACGTGTDQGSLLFNQGNWTGATYPTGAVTITTSRQRFSVQLSVPAGTKEIAVRFYWAGTGTAGANDYVDITGVQLEVGSVATPYERQIYSDQIAQCQRYYWNMAVPANSWFFPIDTSNYYRRMQVQFPVRMRVAPTTFSITAGGGNGTLSGGYPIVETVTTDAARLDADTVAGGYVGLTSFTVSAEL